MTDRKLHTPFDWCQSQRPRMTLNGRYALYCTKHASFGANHENLNEDRPMLSAAKCSPMTLLSANVRLCGYSRGFPGEGASNDSGVVDNGLLVNARAVCVIN